MKEDIAWSISEFPDCEKVPESIGSDANYSSLQAAQSCATALAQCYPVPGLCNALSRCSIRSGPRYVGPDPALIEVNGSFAFDFYRSRIQSLFFMVVKKVGTYILCS